MGRDAGVTHLESLSVVPSSSRVVVCGRQRSKAVASARAVGVVNCDGVRVHETVAVGENTAKGQ